MAAQPGTVSTRLRRPRAAVAAATAAALIAAVTSYAAATPGRTTGPACRPSAAPTNQPSAGGSLPPAAPRYFGHGFRAVRDARLGFPVGGIGGVRPHAPLRHTPIVFVHGNQADAQNWLSVMVQLQRLAGYSMQEMYAISYNGLGNFYAGAPTSAPTQPDEDYFAQNPNGFANGGHGAADEDEIPDLCRFVKAVQAYTGSRHVDIVAHSLGVTIARKLMVDYPSLAHDVVAFVAIAGANHGTTVCRGVESTYYGCNEISPGSPWLTALNAHGESPGPTKWMSVYNGSVGDPFYDPPYDVSSPHLDGATNMTYPGQYHNDLRVEPAEVDDYLSFLLRHGQAGGPTTAELALAGRLAATHPDGRSGELCGVKKLTGC